MKGQINVDALFSGINVDSIRFGVFFHVRFYNENGTLQDVKDILIISDTTLTNRLKNYEKDSLLSTFIEYMKSDANTYDWAMNLILYHIYKIETSSMYYYFYDYYPFKINEWRRDKKNESVLFWQEMQMQKTKKE